MNDTKETLIKDIISQLKKGKSKPKIKKYLLAKHKNLSEEQVKQLINEAVAIKEKRTDTILRVFWIVLLLVTFWFFFIKLAPDTYYNSPIFFPLIGGILLAFFLFQAIMNYRSIEDFVTKHKNDWRTKIKSAMLGVFLVLAVFFMYSISKINRAKVDNELKNNGLVVQGKIIDGYEKITKRTAKRGGISESSSYTLKIHYNQKDGTSKTISKGINGRYYRYSYKEMPVDVIYSEKYPSIVEVLTPEAAKKYLDKKQRKLTPADLIMVIKTENAAVKDSLNNIYYGWHKVENSWINDWLQAAVKKDVYAVYYLTTEANNILRNIEENGFKKISGSEEKVKNYESDKYTLQFISSVERDKNSKNFTVTTTFIYSLQPK